MSNRNNNNNNSIKGGASNYTGTYRHFKIVELNGKEVKLDYGAAIKEHQTPLNAAKKLLKSICLHMGLKGMKKLQCNATYVIKETTQGSSKKMYGPYHGKYSKYTPAEAKKAMASGISFKMKPVVKLHKEKKNMKKNMMKGGIHNCPFYTCRNPACQYYDETGCRHEFRFNRANINSNGKLECPNCGSKNIECCTLER